MALRVIDRSDPSDPDVVIYKDDTGGGTDPIRLVKNNTVGGDIVLPLYLRNDSDVNTYTDVQITPVPDSKIGSSAVNGWQMKILSGVIATPDDDDWNAVSPGNTIDYDDPAHTVGGTATFPAATAANVNYTYPFYIKLSIPAGTPVQITRAVSLKVDYT